MKADLQDLFITSAKEVEVSAGRKAVIIHVPFRLLKSFHAIQQVRPPFQTQGISGSEQPSRVDMSGAAPQALVALRGVPVRRSDLARAGHVTLP